MKTLIALCLLTLSSLALAAPKKELQIGGAYYRKIIHTKDLIADIMPPPAFIIESYLTTLLLLNETEMAMKDKKIDPLELRKIKSMIEELRMLKEGISGRDEIEGYFERIKIWKQDLPESRLKELIVVHSAQEAKNFYSIAEKKFIPLLLKGNVREAKVILGEISSSYNMHKTIVEDAVQLARKDIEELEKETLKSKNPKDKMIKSEAYTKILLLKDLISDILPPPAFVIESYLNDLEMIYKVERNGSPGKEFEGLKKRSVELEKAYTARFDYWKKNLDDKKLKDAFVSGNMSVFFNIQKNSFLKALDKNDLVEAKKIFNSELSPLYTLHRRNIDSVVILTDEQMLVLETEVVSKLSK